MFLEPFSRVLGQSKSKRVLVDVAQSDPRHLNCLHRLGLVLGITDWRNDYWRKLDPAQSTSTAPVEQARVGEPSEITSERINTHVMGFFVFLSQTRQVLRAVLSRL